VTSADPDQHQSAGEEALAAGRWAEARTAFEAALANEESAAAAFGLAIAQWWLGAGDSGVDAAARAYSLFRGDGDAEGAIRAATWLCITYKSNFGNAAAANGWAARAERLLESLPVGPLHGWAWVARAYQLPDLAEARALTERALETGRSHGDADLELVALSQLGRIRVTLGDTATGLALIDEAMAAVLGGERSTLDTVVYTCCDMLNACELATDLERATQWCRVADGFIDRYGCPFLYGECRTIYGSLLLTSGRWADADRELAAAIEISRHTPTIHSKALTRLALLRVRQGRLEEAHDVLQRADARAAPPVDAAVARAALLLARGDASGARRVLRRCDATNAPPGALTSMLTATIESHLATGDVAAARAAQRELAAHADRSGDAYAVAAAADTAARVHLAAGERDEAVLAFDAARRAWSELDLPFEAAMCAFGLARALAAEQPEDAVEHARQALSAFARLGAAPDADRTAAFIRQLGFTARVGAKNTGTLTQREREVLHLLGLGLSNPELAERLHVSRKTASHHVSHILAKLGLRNRAEAAAYAAREPAD
jgi:ATP/maltotriose-dependent transcriptional regulator MalT